MQALAQGSKFWGGVLVIFMAANFAGCAATKTAISKRDLDVQTKMSESIFLEPVGPAKRTIFIQVRNTSDKANFSLDPAVRKAIAAKGYTVTDDPETAHYRLLANVLRVEKADPTAADEALAGGYGSAAIIGVGTGAAVGAATGSAAWGVGAGVAAAGADWIASSMVKDITYMVVTDIEIAEKAPEGVIVRSDSAHQLQQGTSGGKSQRFSSVSNRIKYRTRVVSTANQANLDYIDAAPVLTDGLARALAGLF